MTPLPTRLRSALAMLAVAFILVGSFAGPGIAAAGPPSCSVPGQITPHSGFWYSIKAPSFPSGQQIIWDFAVHPLQPDHLFVTNGLAVMRSLDSGCHWDESFSLGGGALGQSEARILEIEQAAPDVLYLSIQETTPLPKPVVVVSRDAGASWSSPDGNSLDGVFGRVRDLDTSMRQATAAALLVDVEVTEPGVASVKGEQALFVTNNGGGAWEARHRFEDGTQASAGGVSISINAGRGAYSQVAMNHARPNEVWIYGEPGVLHSTGPGEPQDVGIGSPDFMDIALDGDSITAFDRGAVTGQLSTDGGRSFASFDARVPIDTIDLVSGVPALGVMGNLGRVYYRFDLPQGPVTADISPVDGRGVSDPQAVSIEGLEFMGIPLPGVMGRTTNTIEVLSELPKIRVIDPNNVKADIVPPPMAIGDNRLVPSAKRVVLRAGKERTIPYRLALPAATTPLDVYFMIDISGSMQGTINGIRSAMQDIVDRLAALKIDVSFGVGSFRSFNDPPAYERVRDIGPPGAEVAAALNSLEAQGGGQETQMAALLESVTGEGLGGIEPGKNMHFRPGSLRVAIEVTDEPISQGGAHPGYSEVAHGLVHHDVKMVGLAIQEPSALGGHDYEDPGPPADILQLVATGSKATAPAGGVDCDGDGVPEIAEGGPMVCLIGADEAGEASVMADAIVSVLEAVQDIADLDVTVTPSVDTSDPSEVVEAIEPDLFQSVDLKEPSDHAFDVTLACPQVLKRTTYPLRVAVSRRGGALGTAELTLVCDPPPQAKKKRDQVLPLISFAPLAAVLPPVPRPPDPVPEPNPNPQPNPQQNPQGQAGFAAQEQQQPQVAVAHQGGPVANEQVATEEYFMTARRESRIPPVGFVVAVGTVTSLFAYITARTRFRTAGARDRHRRRRPS